MDVVSFIQGGGAGVHLNGNHNVAVFKTSGIYCVI